MTAVELGERVWIATPRRGITYHRLTPEPCTTCGRSTYNGVIFPVFLVELRYEAKPCPRCWPVTS